MMKEDEKRMRQHLLQLGVSFAIGDLEIKEARRWQDLMKNRHLQVSRLGIADLTETMFYHLKFFQHPWSFSVCSTIQVKFLSQNIYRNDR